MMFWKLTSTTIHVAFLRVSILVLVDDVLEEILLQHNDGEGFLFQSLFWWMMFWKQRQRGEADHRGFVSILVLVDDVLEEGG